MVDQMPRMGRNQSNAGTPGGGARMSTFLLLGGIFLAIVVVLASYTTIDAGKIGVRLRFGEASGTMTPGINYLIPFVDQAVVYSTRVVTITYEPVSAYSKDTQESKSKVSISYSVNPAKAIEVYTRYGQDFETSIIGPISQKRIKEIFGNYTAAEIVTTRAKFGQDVQKNVTDNMPEGILIAGVQIENIDFSDEYELAIEAGMKAQAEVKKTEQELAKQRVEAEKVVVNANAAAAARVAQATAEATAIRVKGEAEATAIKAKADALANNPNLVQLTATEKWNGILPQTMIPGSAVPFISMPQGNNR